MSTLEDGAEILLAQMKEYSSDGETVAKLVGRVADVFDDVQRADFFLVMALAVAQQIKTAGARDREVMATEAFVRLVREAVYIDDWAREGNHRGSA